MKKFSVSMFAVFTMLVGCASSSEETSEGSISGSEGEETDTASQALTYGNCVVDSNNKLTGMCVGGSMSMGCYYRTRTGACPVGAAGTSVWNKPCGNPAYVPVSVQSCPL